MKLRSLLFPIAGAALCAGGYLAGQGPQPRVFELRTYTTHPGKLPDLVARFRNHTTRLFEKHGMVNIGYWIPADEPLKSNTLIYIVAHKDRAAAGGPGTPSARIPPGSRFATRARRTAGSIRESNPSTSIRSISQGCDRSRRPRLSAWRRAPPDRTAQGAGTTVTPPSVTW